MRLHPIDIGGIEVPNNVWMAPLAGYTNYPFRKLALRYGAGLTFTEMVSAKGLHYGSENTAKLLLTGEEEKIKAVQLFGHEPEILQEACESEALADFDVVDLNMGCPMPKITGNGEGSALLADPALAAKIVAACKRSGKRVTVKMRIGLTEREIVAADFAKAVRDGGADCITVHGRTTDKVYAGEPDYDAIAAVKKSVDIPVIANGGIFCVADGEKMLERTGADGVMLARAAMYDPRLFCDFTGREKENKKSMILRQLSDMGGSFDEHFTTVYMRKMAVFYLRGEKGAASWRNRLFACASSQELREVLDEIFADRTAEEE